MTEKQYFEEVGLNSDQVTELRQAFDSFDSDKTGAISSETTGKTSKFLVKESYLHLPGQILRMMGVRVSSEELKSIMEDLDVDNSGKLEFNEFVILSARFRKVDLIFFATISTGFLVKKMKNV